MINTAASPVHLIVAAGSHHPGTLAEVLEEYGHRLVDARAFAALGAEDRRVAACVIGQLAVTADDGAVMRERAAAIRSGWWAGWASTPAAVAAAFETAANVLDAL